MAAIVLRRDRKPQVTACARCRRNCEPTTQRLDKLEEAQFRVVNAEAVSPHTKTGWPKVDVELTELRRRFRTAATTQDTGNRAVAVLEAISRTVYDPAIHVREGETEFGHDCTSNGLGDSALVVPAAGFGL